MARCVVLAQCAAQVPRTVPRWFVDPAPDLSPELHALAEWKWENRYETVVQPVYPDDDPELWYQLLARQICARLIAWVRWPGQCTTCHRNEQTKLKLVVAGHNPEQVSRGMDALDRLHQHERSHPLDDSFGDWQARRRLVRSDRGVDWGFRFVVCDYLADTGLWTTVHRWRPPSLWSGVDRSIDDMRIDDATPKTDSSHIAHPAPHTQ